MFPSYRNQTINLDDKSVNWFLCDGSIEGQAKSYTNGTTDNLILCQISEVFPTVLITVNKFLGILNILLNSKKKTSEQPKDDCGS